MLHYRRIVKTDRKSHNIPGGTMICDTPCDSDAVYIAFTRQPVKAIPVTGRGGP
jgi:hypothetical protein